MQFIEFTTFGWWQPWYIYMSLYFVFLTCVCVSDVLDENQSKLSEDLMEFRRDASMLNVSVCVTMQ